MLQESSGLGSASGQDNQCYAWAFANEPQIQIDYAVIEGIRSQIFRALQSAQPAEAGGILLGSADPRSKVTHIRDFQPLIRTHSKTANYSFAPADLPRLEAALAA